MVEPPDNSTSEAFAKLIAPYRRRSSSGYRDRRAVTLYTGVRAQPAEVLIGIDANPRPLEKDLREDSPEPAEGWPDQRALFLQAAVEDLPAELDGVADEIRVRFPWGSLLGALAAGDEASAPQPATFVCNRSFVGNNHRAGCRAGSVGTGATANTGAIAGPC